MEYKKRKVEDLSSPSALCSECMLPGNLTRCSGKCKRFFHANCTKAVIYPGEEWFCPDCSKRVHRCFQCLQYAPDHELVQCKDPSCRKFYHKTRECGGLISCFGNEGSFLCKRHMCSLCKRPASSFSPLQMCFRCTKSYHPDCCPNEVCTLDTNVILCIHHHLDETKYPSLPVKVLEARRAATDND